MTFDAKAGLLIYNKKMEKPQLTLFLLWSFVLYPGTIKPCRGGKKVSRIFFLCLCLKRTLAFVQFSGGTSRFSRKGNSV